MIGPTTSGRSIRTVKGLRMDTYGVRVVAAFMI
jgi:hypothetical protein